MPSDWNNRAAKRGIKWGLGLLGLDVRRRAKLPAVAQQILRGAAGSHVSIGLRRPTGRIEFFGPSGVGKTYFATELARQRSADRSWLMEREALAAGIVHPIEDMPSSQARTHLILRRFENDLARGWPEAQMLRHLRFFLDAVSADVNTSQCDYDLMILRDDGLFHTYSRQLGQLAETAPDLFASLVRNRMGVFCHAPLEIIVDRVMARTSGGVTRLQHRGLDREGIIRVCRERLAEKETLAELLLQVGIPVVNVDLSADQRANIDKVSDAISAFWRSQSERSEVGR